MGHSRGLPLLLLINIRGGEQTSGGAENFGGMNWGI